MRLERGVFGFVAFGIEKQATRCAIIATPNSHPMMSPHYNYPAAFQHIAVITF